MGPSRRQFLKDSIAAAGGLSVSASGCTPNAKRPSFPNASTKGFEPAYLGLEREKKLETLERDLWDVLRNCSLCPRGCGVNRLAGEKGICSSTAALKVHSSGPHFGEERPLVGKGGSGTIFFSNCNLLCCFCQNWQINHRGDGRMTSHETLAQMMIDLQRTGCHNINLVTPTHVVPHIVKALRLAIPLGLRLPLVFNTGGYDSLEVIRNLAGVVDIYLPDFKYQDGKMAARYSYQAADYPDVAAAVIKEMHRQVGILQTDAVGVAQRGLIIRHLVMPQNIAGTDRFVRWVANELSPMTYVNIMAQYHPEHRASEYPELSRQITNGEYLQALDWARAAGLKNLD
jgi:putative pyruvate formate lyase activating enzyme